MRRLFIAMALCSGAPWVASAEVPDGYVVRLDSPTIYLDWGQNTGVHSGDRFTVYRPGEPLKHPVTGAVLGTTTKTIADGVLDRIDEKFAVGHLVSANQAPAPGDRTRWRPAPVAIPTSIAVPTETNNNADTAAAPKEVWRSEVFSDPANGLAIGDLDGDGRPEVAIAFEKHVDVFRWTGDALQPIGRIEISRSRKAIAVESADLKGEKRDELFVIDYGDALNGPIVTVYRLDGTALKNVGHLRGFVRRIDSVDGPTLYWQDRMPSHDVQFSDAAPLRYENGKYKPSRGLSLPIPDRQLFGWVWGDWDGDAKRDLAVLQDGERLRLYMQGTKWSSKEVWGGTKNIFSIGADQQISALDPRLLRYRLPGESKDTLVAAHNIPELGIRFTYLKLYKSAEVFGLRWNGLELVNRWRLSLPTYLADLQLQPGDKPRLWTLLGAPGDKSVVAVYDLP